MSAAVSPPSGTAPKFTEEERPLFPGSRSKFTEKLEFIEPDIYEGIPVYRVMDKKGSIIDPSQDPGVNLVYSIEAYNYTHINLLQPFHKYKPSFITFIVTCNISEVLLGV